MLPAVKGAFSAAQVLAAAGARLTAASNVRNSHFERYALADNALQAGPGGRSSVSGITATVFGPNGFVGSYVVNELARRGSQVVTPFRSVETEVMHLKQMGDLGQIVMLGEFDIRDEAKVQRAISKSNVVINCIGMRLETMNFTFEEAHIKFPERLAKACAKQGVERLIHLSDLGASADHASKRLRTKALGEEALRAHYPNATIFKPGPAVGIEDHFYNYLIYQLGYGLAAPVIEGGANKVQPTYVVDIAEACVQALSMPESVGKTYHLGGPEVLTMADIYKLIRETLRLRQDTTLPVPAWVARMMYKPRDNLRKNLPALPMGSWLTSVDYVEEQLVDKVVPKGALGYADLGLTPMKVTDGLPMEPVRHFRVGGYRWGDMGAVASNVPESIRKYYNIK